MSIAIVLSGGGAKGDFQVGALRFIYDQGVRPDVLCGTSVGSINAIKLAEGESSADPQQGLAGLEAIWQSLRQDSDMYLEEAWLSDPDMDPQVRKVLTGRASDLDVTAPPGEILEWGDIGWAIAKFQGLAFLVTDGQALLRSLKVITSQARALYNLGPISAKLATQLDISKLASWASGGHKLRLGMVGLESGRLRWVTETGEVIERDGSQVFDRNTAPVACQALAGQLAEITEEVRSLQNDLQAASSSSEKSAIAPQIRRAQQQRSQIQARYNACLQSQPITIPLRLLDIRDGVLASASIPGIFPPMRLGGENYVIPAPPFPSAVFQWQMVQDGVEWFGTLTPALTVAQAEPAECVALRANFAAHEQTIQQLEASRAGLNPRDPIDREEIRQIGKEIEQERRKVEELKQQASQLGCHIP